MPADHTGRLVRQRLLRALCERERTRWHDLGRHLSFNPDLPLADQLVALATLTTPGDQAAAVHLLTALPGQAEVTRIGAEALTVWAHRLYAGPGYWNPMRPDLLAEQHLADTAQLTALARAATQAADGQNWETGVWTQLLAELTRGAPNQPALQETLSELLAATLPRIIHLASHHRSRRTRRHGRPRARASPPAGASRRAGCPDARTQRAARCAHRHPHQPASHPRPRQPR